MVLLDKWFHKGKLKSISSSIVETAKPHPFLFQKLEP